MEHQMCHKKIQYVFMWQTILYLTVTEKETCLHKGLWTDTIIWESKKTQVVEWLMISTLLNSNVDLLGL